MENLVSKAVLRTKLVIGTRDLSVISILKDIRRVRSEKFVRNRPPYGQNPPQ
ncbi:hypothetical protein [Neobacillus drentensis]|uniref:hypothetical protein n=1 Tax=Neobacillus drentensis TaxID=220684 RepID=UPI0012FC9C15|nr:hypothetical protein [Neobacillus drentensis]